MVAFSLGSLIHNIPIIWQWNAFICILEKFQIWLRNKKNKKTGKLSWEAVIFVQFVQDGEIIQVGCTKTHKLNFKSVNHDCREVICVQVIQPYDFASLYKWLQFVMRVCWLVVLQKAVVDKKKTAFWLLEITKDLSCLLRNRKGRMHENLSAVFFLFPTAVGGPHWLKKIGKHTLNASVLPLYAHTLAGAPRLSGWGLNN